MKLIALRDMNGPFGTVTPGQEFHCADDVARELLQGGVVKVAPIIRYETKVIHPEAPEVAALPGPFRVLRDADTAEPGEVLAHGDAVLQRPDPPAPRTDRAMRGRRRPAKDARR